MGSITLELKSWVFNPSVWHWLNKKNPKMADNQRDGLVLEKVIEVWKESQYWAIVRIRKNFRAGISLNQ